MLSYRLGTVNDFHWGFKPVLSYSKPHTFLTFFGEEKERKMHLISPTRPLGTTKSLGSTGNIKTKTNKMAVLILP